MRQRSRLKLLILGLSALLAGSARASEDIERLGDYGAWAAFRFIENGNPVCYAATAPVNAERGRRDETYVLVTHRPAENRLGEASFVLGAEPRPGSQLQVTVSHPERKLVRRFALFTEGDGAWTLEREDDRALLEAMAKGRMMVLRDVSPGGGGTRDIYVLQGFAEAHAAIDAACGCGDLAFLIGCGKIS